MIGPSLRSAARALLLRRVNSQGTHSRSRALAATFLATILRWEANWTVYLL